MQYINLQSKFDTTQNESISKFQPFTLRLFNITENDCINKLKTKTSSSMFFKPYTENILKKFQPFTLRLFNIQL